MITVADPKVVLVSAKGGELLAQTRSAVPEWSPIVGAVDDLVTEQCDFGPSELEAASDAPLQDPIAPDAVAHLLFTSGSTGLPKAVAVTHANVRNFVDWAVRYFDT